MTEKVVKFPKAAHPKAWVVEKQEESPSDLFLNGFNFTCPECSHVNKFNTNGMIFKSVEFYCKGCGFGFKISNPAMKKS